MAKHSPFLLCFFCFHIKNQDNHRIVLAFLTSPGKIPRIHTLLRCHLHSFPVAALSLLAENWSVQIRSHRFPIFGWRAAINLMRSWLEKASSVLLLSHVRLFATPWTAACKTPLSITNSWSFFQTHVHQVGDAIQPFHPLLFPSPPAFNLSCHNGLFQWVSSSHQVAKVLEFQLQCQSFQWIFRTDFL